MQPPSTWPPRTPWDAGSKIAAHWDLAIGPQERLYSLTGRNGANRPVNGLDRRNGLRKGCRGRGLSQGEPEQTEREVSPESPFVRMYRHVRRILRLSPLHARANALYEKKCRMCQSKPVFQKPAFRAGGKCLQSKEKNEHIKAFGKQMISKSVFQWLHTKTLTAATEHVRAAQPSSTLRI